MTHRQFSSFQIGKMLNVSRQAVNQWIDKGYIPSYRTPGGHRRVNQDDLMAFLKNRNIPLPESLQNNTQAAKDQGKRHVMLMFYEDDDYLTLTRSAILGKRSDLEISTFTNGVDVLMAIGAHPPDLLVMDLDLPCRQGLELCRRLKSNELTENLPILILVDNEDSTVLNQLRELGIQSVQPRQQPFGALAEQVCDEMRHLTTPITTSSQIPSGHSRP